MRKEEKFESFINDNMERIIGEFFKAKNPLNEKTFLIEPWNIRNRTCIRELLKIDVMYNPNLKSTNELEEYIRCEAKDELKIVKSKNNQSFTKLKRHIKNNTSKNHRTLLKDDRVKNHRVF
jgi:hypothetical protein